jgi:hypothetical protein
MKETTKYNDYRFVGKINIDEIMPWFDFDQGKPWDDPEVPWVLENKVRREILIILANNGPLDFESIYKLISFSPKPLLIKEDEYQSKVRFQWDKSTIENHLLNLEWYKLIEIRDGMYQITFPVFNMDNLESLNKYAMIFAESWIKIINDIKSQLKKNILKKDKTNFYELIIEKTVQRLHDLLKENNLLPDVPNIRALWLEQLRKIKFEEWLDRNF